MNHYMVWGRILALVMLLCCACAAWAQKMDFTFSGLSGVESRWLTDGTMLVQLPAGTDLSRMSEYGMNVKADGTNAQLSDIVPNPSTKSDYQDGQLNVFYYQGKAYKVRFSSGAYVTAVFFSNALMGGLSMTKSDLADYAQRIAAMGTDQGIQIEFSHLPGYIPTADIAFYLGDMTASNSLSPVIHTLDDEYVNIVNKCAVVTGRFEGFGTNATVTEYRSRSSHCHSSSQQCFC